MRIPSIQLRSPIAPAFACVGALSLAGCFFPAAGPYSIAIDTHASPTLPYALVKLTPETIETVAEFEPAVLAGVFTDRAPPAPIKIGIGDVVGVTIFEAAAGGLFIPVEAGVRPGNFVTIPEQIVDNAGNITVPFAGAVRAAGRTNVEVQADIVERIRNRAIEPQVVVTTAQQRTSLISVVGEVTTSVRYPAASLGASDRITDAITRAGGLRGQGYETWVMLERRGRRATVPFANLVYEPKNNIYVRPGDRIYVYREQQKFLAFGAHGQQGEFTFDAWRINLAEAVGKSGGLLDVQANPTAVYLYRREPRLVAKHLGINVSKFQTEYIPVIFEVSFSDPAGYFLATKLQMRNQDVLYAANAPSVDISKFLNFAYLATTTATSAFTLYTDIKNPSATAPVTTTTVITQSATSP